MRCRMWTSTGSHPRAAKSRRGWPLSASPTSRTARGLPRRRVSSSSTHSLRRSSPLQTRTGCLSRALRASSRCPLPPRVGLTPSPASILSATRKSVLFRTSPAASVGEQPGFLLFGPPPGGDCAPSCCEDSSCSTKCGIPFVCFSLVGYDDLEPKVTYASVTTGPNIGGTRISVSVAFGGAHYAETLPPPFLVSSADETLLTLISPEYPETGLISVLVTPILQTARAVAFSFRYDLLPAALVESNSTRPPGTCAAGIW
ncbi:hypothetical protein T484DRAFT_1906580 [Baffinella frigidus]|nr:hypothetical protein T484DRAFT_1906580 [Cryptophyta sp. CCMP2293]